MAQTPLALDTSELGATNLAAVRRVDPDVVEILAHANYCAIYESLQGAWVRALSLRCARRARRAARRACVQRTHTAWPGAPPPAPS